ncbi:MAG: hypothetical protein ABFD18_20725 [Syntrophomonas sp.]
MEGLSSRVILRTGLQVVGVVTLIKGVAYAIVAWGGIESSQGLSQRLQIMNALVPLFLIVAGVFLVIGSKSMVEKLCPDNEEKPESGEAIFSLAMKILGAVLIVQALPDAVQVLSNLIYIKSVGLVWDTDVQRQFIYTRFLSTFLYFIFGWYLLKGGQLLIRMAFPDINTSKLEI